MSHHIKVPLDDQLPDETEHYILFERDQHRTRTNIYYQTRSFTIGMTPQDVRILMSRLHNALRLTVELDKPPLRSGVYLYPPTRTRQQVKEDIWDLVNDITDILEI